MTQVTTRTRAEVYQMWIDALRSGKYKQAEGQLRDDDIYCHTDRNPVEGFCCLGVLCDLAIKDGMSGWDKIYGPKSDAGTLPPKMMKWLGLNEDITNHLITLNDEKGKSFKQIAKVIEEDIMPAVL